MIIIILESKVIVGLTDFYFMNLHLKLHCQPKSSPEVQTISTISFDLYYQHFDVCTGG